MLTTTAGIVGRPVTIRSHSGGSGILGGPVDGPERLAARFPACEAKPGLPIAHRSSGFAGRLVALEGDEVVVAGQTGLEKRFRYAPGSFSVGGQAVHLVPPPPASAGGRRPLRRPGIGHRPDRLRAAGP